LNDESEKERELGLASARKLIGVCDVLIMGKKYGISEGMEAETQEAQRLGIDIIFLTEHK
jgi:hypothetical protein